MNILKECEGARSIAIGGHIRPDGDCVGACLGLYQYLRKALPDTYVKVFLERPADIFSELKGYEEIDSVCEENTVFDLFFCLDCASDRLGAAQKYFDGAGRKININHHISNPGCGDSNYVKPQVGSASELVYDLMEKEYVDREIAKAVYIGMIHDTGVFQYSNTSPDTLRKAADLIGYGFDFPRLIEETFYQKNYVQAQIMGRALMESIRFLDNRCIVSCVSAKDMLFYGAKSSDLDGIVNQLRNIKGVDCAIFLYEIGQQEYKVSLRSNEAVDVSAVAAEFGGGGHKRAAGCTLKGSFHDIVCRLSLPIERQLRVS